MTKKIRVGIVGANFGAKVHATAFRRDHRAQVVALASRRLTTARHAAGESKIPSAYGDWRLMFKECALDAVSIAVPPKHQPKIAAEALRRGIAVFAEKPLAASMKEASRLASLARKLRVPQLIDYEFPEIPSWLRAKKLLDSGAIGRLRHVSLIWRVETYANRHKLVSWKTRTTEGGGALAGFGCHALYALEWFAGRIRHVGARLSQAAGIPGKGDTLCSLELKFTNGVSALAEICTHAFPSSGLEIRFFGEHRQIYLVNTTADYARGFRLYLSQRKLPEFKRIIPPKDFRISHIDGRAEAAAGLVKKFLDWIEFGKPAKPDFSDALRVERLLEAARLSNKKKGAQVSV